MTTNDPRARRWAAAYAERPRLLRIARRRTASEAEAEDCVSEAMLRCIEFEGLDEERLPAFLTTVTLRLCADQHRGRARLARVGGQLAPTLDEPSPEDGVCDRAEAVWLVERLRGMSAHQRRVVAARAEGLSCDDVARRLGVSVDAVKSAVARVRGTARAALAKTLGLVPVAHRSSRALTRHGDLAAGGVFAGAVAGLTLGGLLAMPPAPRGGADPAPPVAKRVAAAGDVRTPAAAAVLPVPAARAAGLTTDEVVIVTDDPYQPGGTPPPPGRPPTEVDGPISITIDEHPEKQLEEQVEDCRKHGVNVLKGDIRCREEDS